MKSRYPIKAGCVPRPGSALAANVLPEYFQRNDLKVTLDTGEVVESCHLISDGRRFNFRGVYDNQLDWNYLYITQFSYIDDKGETQIVEVEPRNPHPIDKGNGSTYFGYVTKVNDKRWGVLVSLNWKSGSMQITADEGSPITGTLVQFI